MSNICEKFGRHEVEHLILNMRVCCLPHEAQESSITNELSLIILIFFMFTLINYGQCECQFDQIKSKHPHQTIVSYKRTLFENTSQTGRSRRDTLSSTFLPIRIKPFFMNLDDELSIDEQNTVKTIMEEVIKKVSRLFSVYPVSGTLLLERSLRSYCLRHNGGKCVSLKPSYQGEDCEDNIHIPDDHLEGLYLWNGTHYNQHIGRGSGVQETDYIIYVQASTFTPCQSTGQSTPVIAYATYCQLDQNDRPIAGYINICPSLLKDIAFTKQRIFTVVLHEMFHALGFSSDLFDKFKECYISKSGNLTCEDRQNTVVKVLDAERLVTPEVVRCTSNHYGCSTHQTDNEFGPILQTSSKGEIKSHWDEAFVYSSIMSPNVGLAEHTLLDPISLALFEDTGWYIVNYTMAEELVWGKGGGCRFGLYPDCEDDRSGFFCEAGSTGCHHLHLSKGTCETNPALHGCHVFVSYPKDVCSSEKNSDTSSRQFYGVDSRCLKSNLTEIGSRQSAVSDSGGCYRCQYLDESTVQVAVNGSYQWYNCTNGQTLQVSGYDGLLQCPDDPGVCWRPEHTSTVSSQPTTVTTSTTSVTTHSKKHKTTNTYQTDDSPEMRVALVFDGLQYELLNELGDKFERTVLKVISDEVGLPIRRVDDITVQQDPDTGGTILLFTLLPAANSHDGEKSSVVLEKLRLAVESGELRVTLPDSDTTYLVTAIRLEDGGTSGSLSSGVIAGIAIGTVTVLLVAGVLSYVLYRLYGQRGQVTPTNTPASGTRPKPGETGRTRCKRLPVTVTPVTARARSTLSTSDITVIDMRPNSQLSTSHV